MNNVSRKILIISYVFPPFAAVGVYRVLKFCKYLLRNNIDPIVFTPENPRTLAYDESLMEQVTDSVKIYRMKLTDIFHRKSPTRVRKGESHATRGDSGSEPSVFSRIKRQVQLYFSVPDRVSFWAKNGLKAGIDIVKKENIDFVLSTSPPQSVHVLGSSIARKSGCPHVADFRDLWTQNTNYFERKLPKYLLRRDRRLEKLVLENAAAITVNTATFKRQLLENNPYLDERQIEVVTNGVDPDDFNDLAVRRRRNERFTMLYTGSLSDRHRNPEFFFKALRRWIDEKKGVSNRIRVRLVGNLASEFAGMTEKYELDDIVEKKDWLPQHKVLEEIFAADILLLFQGFDPALKAAIPRKLYEYMIANRPILAFAPPGEIPDLIHRYDCGKSISDPAPEPIRTFLDKKLSEWEKQPEFREDRGLRLMPELETSVQVGQLVKLLHRIEKSD